MKYYLIRASLILVAVVVLSNLSACSKCSVPTFGTMACNDKPTLR
jgi:hypothetical protein